MILHSKGNPNQGNKNASIISKIHLVHCTSLKHRFFKKICSPSGINKMAGMMTTIISGSYSTLLSTRKQ